MDIDDLKRAWSRVRVEYVVREAARPWSLYLGLVAWALFVLAAGSFWFDHREVTHLLVAGLVLHAYGIVVIVVRVTQAREVSAIDYTAPIVTVQRRLAEIHRGRIKVSLVLGLAWWLLWVPSMMVLAALAGIDLYAGSPAWMWSSLGIGVVGIIGSVVFARWVAGRAVQSPAWRRVIDDLAGRSLLRAARDLEDVTRFAD